jgi:hypothetical protein
MHLCPMCRSHNTHRSHARSLWEGWRQKVTNKRPYRCLDCKWRGWGVDLGTRSADDEAFLTEPPNPETSGLARDDRRKDLDLDALDRVLAEMES